MSIPASSVVNLSLTTTPQGPSRAGYGTGLFATRETGVIPLHEGVRYYTSQEGVDADWSGKDVSNAATVYFGQNPSPELFAVGERYMVAQAGYNLGSSSGVEGDYTNWVPITDGEFTISIDGDSQDLSAITFAAVTDMDDVAALIETKLQAVATGGFTAALCVWDSTRFKITSGTTGASSTVSYMSVYTAGTGTDISNLMAMENGNGTTVTGIDAETDIDDMWNRFANASNDWYVGFLNITDRDGTDAEDSAAWFETQYRQLWIVSNNPDALASGISTDIGSVLNALSYRRTWMHFSSYPTQYPEIASFAKAAVVQFTNGTDTTITMKFQQPTGVNAEDITEAQATILTGKGYNMIATVGGVNIVQEGIMVAGEGVWQDTIHGTDWLKNAIEVEVYNLFLTIGTKVAYTDEGVQSIVQRIKTILVEGRTNGLIAPSGFKSTDDTFLAEGFEISATAVAAVSSTVKQSRESPPIVFYAIGGGAIHFANIAGTFEG